MANKVSIVSLGCPKNLVDSDKLAQKLISSGFSYINNPEGADILLINTCGFIEEAKKESIEEILKLAEIKEGSEGQRGRVTVNSDSVTKEKLTLKSDTATPKKSLIIFGCLAKRYKNKLIKEIPEIDAIFGVGEEDKIVEYCKRLKGSEGQRVKGSGREIGSDPIHRFTPSPLHPFSSYAYLKIAEGCNKRCSYCIIPSIRGRYKSSNPDDILKEAERLVREGAKELVLVGQDTACYGKDLNGYDISNLLRDLCSINGDFWIRLLYAYPSSIKDSLLNIIAEKDKICKYLDIPLQHSEDRILRLMKRSGTKKGYLNLIEKIRDSIPDITLRTTFIVGFPTETDKELNSLVDFIEEVGFDRLGAFKYSQEEGTPASKMKEQILEDVKKKRVEKLMKYQAHISLEKNKKLIGKPFRAIIDEISYGIALGRLYSHAPEIDGAVIIEVNSKQYAVSSTRKLPTAYSLLPTVRVGDFVTVRIIDAFDYDLKGIIV